MENQVSKTLTINRKLINFKIKYKPIKVANKKVKKYQKKIKIKNKVAYLIVLTQFQDHIMISVEKKVKQKY